MSFRNKNILIISPSPWDVSFPARQHYARELAKSGAFVYYLNPPSKADSKIELSENLWVVDYKLNGGFMGLFKLSEANLSEKINKLIDKKIDIIWSFDCNRFRDLNMFGSDSYKIYTKEDWNSDHASEIEIANSSDIVLCLSEPLKKQLGEVSSKKILFDHALGNVFVEAGFRKKDIMANTQFASGRIRCGYLGNMQNKHIDTAVFETIIRENPMVEFHIVGPFVKESNLAGSGNKTWEDPFVEFLMSAANVRMYGSLMTVRTAEILQTMDMFLICYETEKNADIVANPQKLIEYLSVGNVIVSSLLLDHSSNSDLVLMPKQNKELPALFKQAQKEILHYNTDELRKKRVAFALDHTYEKQLQKLEKIVSGNDLAQDSVNSKR
jgi:hypothetical protein